MKGLFALSLLMFCLAGITCVVDYYMFDYEHCIDIFHLESETETKIYDLLKLLKIIFFSLGILFLTLWFISFAFWLVTKEL